VIIEDDYDSESNFMLNPLPALKASDRSGRVIYVSSLSKALSPGLRLGFMVADPDLIDEAARCGGWSIAIRRPIFSIRWPISSPRATMKPTCGATTTTPPSAGTVSTTRYSASAGVPHHPRQRTRQRLLAGHAGANQHPAADLARRPRRGAD
jgi:hypothetical protein